MGSKKQKAPPPTKQFATTTAPSQYGLENQDFKDYTKSLKDVRGQGGFAPTSGYTSNAIKSYADAATKQNALLDPAMKSAQGFIEGTGENPYLQNLIQSQLNNAQRGAQLATGTEAAAAGQIGSPAAQGLFAERFGSAAAPIVSNALSNDYTNRQNLAAQFTMAAPKLGSAEQQYAAQGAALQQQAGDLDVQQKSAPAQNLLRYGEAVGAPQALAPVQLQNMRPEDYNNPTQPTTVPKIKKAFGKNRFW